MSDERIEAVARALQKRFGSTMHWSRSVAGEAVAALDRLRDARSEDEEIREAMERLIDNDPPTWVVQVAHNVLKSLAARVPQGEDARSEDEGRRHAIEDEAAASLGSDKRDGPRQLHCVTCGVTVPVDVQHAEHLALHIGHQCRYVEVAEREHTGHHGQPCWCVVERIERAALAAARVQSEDHVGHGTYRHEETGGTDGSPQGEDHEAGIEAAVRAEAEKLGYRSGEFIDDHLAIARAAIAWIRDGFPGVAVKFEERLSRVSPSRDGT